MLKNSEFPEIGKNSFPENLLFPDEGIIDRLFPVVRKAFLHCVLRPVAGILRPVAVIPQHEIAVFGHFKSEVGVLLNPLFLEIPLIQGLRGVINIYFCVLNADCFSRQAYDPLYINPVLIDRIMENNNISALWFTESVAEPGTDQPVMRHDSIFH